MGIQTVAVSDLRRRTSDLIKAVREEGEAVYVTRYGRPVVVLVEVQAYRALRAQLEELSDLVSLGAAAGEPVRPYDDFLAELGRGAGRS